MQDNISASSEFIGFWRNQISNTPSLTQKVFDVIFGIIAPVLCLYFDPIVFRDTLIFCSPPGGENTMTNGHFAIFAYTLIGLGMLALAIWLVVGPKLGHTSAFFAGIFFAGAEIALAFGVVLLPWSIFGLIFIIGLAGFIPFLTAFVYLRNGVRAWRSARQQEPPKPRSWVFAVALTAALLVYVVPAPIQWQAWVLFPEISIPEPLPPCAPDP